MHPAPLRRRAVPQERNTCADAGPIALRADQAHFEPVLPGRDIVVKQPHGAVVVGHEDIDSPVVVDVADRHATADIDALERRSGTITHFGEPVLAFIVKQQVALTVRVRLGS